MFKKHVIVKVREGSVKTPMKVFSKVADKVYFIRFGCEVNENIVKV